MLKIFKFSNWNQLSGLRSKEYPNIEIRVTQFNSKQLIGTKIDIVERNNNLIYFSGFVRIMKSERFNPLAVYDVDEMIKRINSYGFNVAIIPPLELPPNVIDILTGLKALGYRYLTLQYIRETNTTDRSLYQSEIDNLVIEDSYVDRYLPPPYRVYSNRLVFATKGSGEANTVGKLTYTQPQNIGAYVISNSPEFNWEDFKWMEATRVYSIELLLNPKETSATFISDAIVSSDSTEETDITDDNGD